MTYPESYWNYRLLKFKYSDEVAEQEGEKFFYELCEVHYALGEPTGFHYAQFSGSSPEEVLAAMKQAMEDAGNRPPIEKWESYYLEQGGSSATPPSSSPSSESGSPHPGGET